RRPAKGGAYRGIAAGCWPAVGGSPSNGVRLAVPARSREPRALTIERTTTMFKSVSNSLILRGVLALIVGIIALAWPSVTVLALAILFAVFAFMDAGFQGMRAFSSGKAGPVIGHLLLALVDLAAGVVALVWPSPTALVLTLVVGIWAFAGGCLEIFAGFGSGES